MHPLLALPQFGLAIRSGRTVFGQRCHSAEQLFDAIDRDHSGAISLDELRRGLSRLDIKGGDAEAFIRTVDSSKDGEVSRVELVAALDSDELQRQAYLNTLKSKAAANLRQRRFRLAVHVLSPLGCEESPPAWHTCDARPSTFF